MKADVDFNTVLVTAYGKEMKAEEDRELRAGHVAINALVSSWQGDKRDGTQKTKDWNLSLRISKTHDDDEDVFGVVTIKDKEATAIKEAVNEVYQAPGIYAQIAALVDAEDVTGEEKDGDDTE